MYQQFKLKKKNQKNPRKESFLYCLVHERELVIEVCLAETEDIFREGGKMTTHRIVKRQIKKCKKYGLYFRYYAYHIRPKNGWTEFKKKEEILIKVISLAAGEFLVFKEICPEYSEVWHTKTEIKPEALPYRVIAI